jgi:hypothetical protein
VIDFFAVGSELETFVSADFDPAICYADLVEPNSDSVVVVVAAAADRFHFVSDISDWMTDLFFDHAAAAAGSGHCFGFVLAAHLNLVDCFYYSAGFDFDGSVAAELVFAAVGCCDPAIGHVGSELD